MSSKKGFFCELPLTVIGKIKRIAKHKDVAQGAVVELAMASVPDPHPAVEGRRLKNAAKANGQEMLARAIVKDAKRRPFVPPTRVQLNVLRANRVSVTPGSMSRSAAAKMITEIMIMKRSKREGRAARRRVRG